jgi:hypothetical protein
MTHGGRWLRAARGVGQDGDSRRTVGMAPRTPMKSSATVGTAPCRAWAHWCVEPGGLRPDWRDERLVQMEHTSFWPSFQISLNFELIIFERKSI